MTANEIRNRALDGAFLAPLAVTLCIYGQTVVVELATVPDHAARLAYALKVFADPEGYAKKLAFALATVPEISNVTGQVSDATLLAVVTSAWGVLMQVP